MALWQFKDSFTLHSDIGLEAIVICLGLHIAPAPLISWRWPLPYDGEVTAAGFKAVRLIGYQNAFLPRIKGRFESRNGGTAIHVTMAPHPWVMGLSAFLGLLSYGMVLPFYLSARTSIVGLIYLGLPIVFCFLAWLRFWTEARRSRKDLIRFTNGRLLRPERIGSLGFPIER